MVVDELPPAGLSWGEYVERWVHDRGGWLPLADQLIHRAGDRVDVPADPQTVERGLRRLARRGHKPGGQYGRWMLRLFGVTSPVEQWVKWLGTYHTRFADLPSGLRLEQLSLWNRPPIAESPLVCWIELGIAMAHHSRADVDACQAWLARAERHVAAAGVTAEIELHLVRGELATLRGDHAALAHHLALVDERLATTQLPDTDVLPYRARLEALRAARFTRPPAGEAVDLERARACYAAIPDAAIPFVAFRRYLELAYCAWQLGETGEAEQLARRAIDEAGDGGLVRMRVMALNLLSRIVPPAEAPPLVERMQRLASALEDEALLRRSLAGAPTPR